MTNTSWTVPWAVYALCASTGVWFGVHWGYVIAMSAKDALAAGRLTLYWKVMLLPVAVVGLLLDFVFNYIFGWMFLAIPRPVLFSGTVQHHYRKSAGWRLKLAQFFAKNLNVFDDHIKP